MEIKKILVIRIRRVGDAVLSSTLCTSLKKTFPNAQIHYVLNANISPLFEHHPDIDKLISFSDDEKKIFVYLRKVRQVMLKNDYDIIVDMRATVRTLFFSFFSLKTPYRIGYYKKYNRWIHNMRVPIISDDKTNAVQTSLSLLDPLSAEFGIIKDPNFRLYYTEQEKNSFGEYMKAQGVDLNKPIIVCAVTARDELKVWLKENMKETLCRLLDKYKDAQLIFNYGGKIEQEYAENLYAEIQGNDRIFINVEAKNLRQLIALFANSDFFFGNEGGPRHISQALDVPSFAIYTHTSKFNWLPNMSERFQGIEPADINPEKAIDPAVNDKDRAALIDVDSVWKRLDMMLGIFLNRKKKNDELR